MSAVTLLGSTFDTSAGNKTVTATPAVGDLPVIVEGWSNGAAASSTPTDNNSDGLGTYTQIQVCDGNGGIVRAGIFIRDHLVGSASSTVFTSALPTNTGGGLAVLIVSAMTNISAAAARQSGFDDGDTSGSVPIVPYFSSLPALATNPQIGAVINGSNPAGVTAPTGFTLALNTGWLTPTVGIGIVTLDSGGTASSVTWGGTSATNFGAVAAEMNATAPVVALPSDTPFVMGGRGAGW